MFKYHSYGRATEVRQKKTVTFIEKGLNFGPKNGSSIMTMLQLTKSYQAVKVKIKSSLYLTKHHATKTYWKIGRYSSTHS
jgi:hypothetical protein